MNEREKRKTFDVGPDLKWFSVDTAFHGLWWAVKLA
jgi:hypothetical protein